MDRLDTIFDQFDEKTSSLNSRLEQLLTTERSMAQSVDQMSSNIDNLRLTNQSAASSVAALQSSSSACSTSRSES